MLKIVVAYFTVRLIYILVTYWWDIFIFDYMNIEKKYEANFHILTKYFLAIIFLLITGSILGVTYKNLAIIAGALGVGIGFGLQNIANNFISGIIMLFERPIRVGDVIEIDNEVVVVSQIGSRSTVVNTFHNSSIIIPNSHFISNNLINWTLVDNIIARWIDIGVEYGTDTKKVVEIITKILDENPNVLKNPKATVYFNNFGESSLDFKIKYWTDAPLEHLTIRSSILTQINEEFKKAGINIPFPQREIIIKKSV